MKRYFFIFFIPRFFSVLLIVIVFLTGCTGDNGHLKSLSEKNSKAKQQILIDNWSDYNISYRPAVIVFDPKNDDGRILLGGNKGWWWVIFRDQGSWQDFVEANTTNQGDFSPVGTERPMTGLREIWGPDNQFYGYVSHQQGSLSYGFIIYAPGGGDQIGIKYTRKSGVDMPEIRFKDGNLIAVKARTFDLLGPSGAR